MGWERQKPFTTEQPSPPSSGGWLISGVLAVIAGVLLFVLHASGTFSALKAINIWLFALIPVVLWILTFSTCGYLYGREMERFQFFQREADIQCTESHKYLVIRADTHSALDTDFQYLWLSLWPRNGAFPVLPA